MFMILGFILLIFAAIHDIRKRELARWMIVCAGILCGSALCYGLFHGESTFLSAALSIAPGAALMALAFLSRESIGYGDGLFLLLLGPVFGLERAALGGCLAFFLSALLSVILLACRRVNRKSALPFLPFLASGLGVVSLALG